MAEQVVEWRAVEVWNEDGGCAYGPWRSDARLARADARLAVEANREAWIERRTVTYGEPERVEVYEGYG